MSTLNQKPYKADDELRSAVTEALAGTPGVHTEQIVVFVRDGTVKLSAVVLSYPEKEAAVHAALRVPGITGAVDEMFVRHNWGPLADADIAREAEIALAEAHDVPATVTAAVHEHVITLSGEVGDDLEDIAARQAVAALAGVRGVWSQLRVTP
jgi:osmotically-inducible protein OsmY